MATKKGAVVIDTSLNTRKIDSGFKSLDKKTQSLINKYNKSVDSIKKQEIAIQSLKSKLEELTSGNKTPASIKNLETELKKAEKETSNLQSQYDKLTKEIETANLNLEFWKGTDDTKMISKAQEEVNRLDQESIGLATSLENAKDKATKLQKSLSDARINVNNSTEVKNLSSQLSVSESKLRQTKEEANQTRKEIKRCFSQKLKLNTDGISKGFDNIGKKLDSFKRKITGMITTIAIFSLIRKGLESLKNGFISLLKTDDNFNSSLNQIKANLMTAFAPIYNAVLPAINTLMNALTKVTGTIATFVSSLFGISTSNATKQAKKLSSALKDATKSGDDAKGSLASFDKLEVIGSENSSGSSSSDNEIDYSGQIESSSKLLEFLNQVKDVLATLFEPFQRAWETQGLKVIDGIKNAFDGIKSLGSSVFGSILEVWTNGTGQIIIENYLKLFTDILNIIGNIARVLSKAWDNNGNGTKIIQSIADIFIDIQKFVISIADSLNKWTVSEGFQNALNTVISMVTDLFGWLSNIANWIFEMYDTYVAPVVDNLLDCISEIIVAIGAVWNFLKPIVNMIIENVKNVLEPVIAGLMQRINGSIDILKGIMQFITGIFTGDWKKAFDGLKNIVSGIFNQIKGIFTTVFGVLGASAQNAWNGIKTVFSTVASFFKNIFTTAWNAVKAVFSNGGKIFDGIKEGIVKAFTSIVNTIIKGINKVVATPFSAINTALSKIKKISILGAKPFNFISTIKVPQIPQLATGTVIPPRQEFMAILGDQKHGTNIEAPLDTIKQADKEALQEILNNNKISNQSDDREIVIKELTIINKIGDVDISKTVVKGIRVAEKQLGKPLLVN